MTNIYIYIFFFTETFLIWCMVLSLFVFSFLFFFCQKLNSACLVAFVYSCNCIFQDGGWCCSGSAGHQCPMMYVYILNNHVYLCVMDFQVSPWHLLKSLHYFKKYMFFFSFFLLQSMELCLFYHIFFTHSWNFGGQSKSRRIVEPNHRWSNYS